MHDLNDNAAGLLPFRPHFLFDFHPYRHQTTLKQALCSSVALQVTLRLFLAALAKAPVPCLIAMQRVEAPFDISDFVLIVQQEIPTSGTHSVLLPKLSILSVFLYKLTITSYIRRQ